jgi:hypothetical protein
VALIAVAVFAPVTALRFEAEWAVWPFVVVTSLLQLSYFALLARRLDARAARHRAARAARAALSAAGGE